MKIKLLPSLACGAFGGVNENPFCDCWLRFCGWLWFVLGNVNDVFAGVCSELNEWSGKSWSYSRKLIFFLNSTSTKFWLGKFTIKPTFISRTCNFNFSNTSPCCMFGKFWRFCRFCRLCTPIKFPNMPNGWFTGNCVWWLNSREIKLKKFKYFTTHQNPNKITLNVMNLYYVWDFFDNPYRYYHSYVNLH